MDLGKISGEGRMFKFLQSSSNVFIILLMISCFCLEKGNAFKGRVGLDPHYCTLPLNSMLPPFVCNPTSSKGPSRKASLKVVHKFNPCSARTHDNGTNGLPTMSELLLYDESRVNSIRARLKSLNSANKGEMSESESGANLPTASSTSSGVGNYIVTVGLGTPRKELNLAFDTGSHITWTQCQPCAVNCYRQRDRIFDPAASVTYSNVTCTSTACSTLSAATSYRPRCAGSATCVYEAHYGDGTYSVGEWAKDRLTLTSTDAVDGFLFGCGQNNDLYFGDNAGLLGLGSAQLSIVSQTSKQYGKYFSYCLPTKTGSDGHLTFGKSETNTNTNVKYIPFLSSRGMATFYFIEVTAITVNGHKLPINPTVFKTSGTIIDSGTVVTRLPPAAYTALRDDFRQLMRMYPAVPSSSLLDTCYDLRKYSDPKIPKISFVFGGDLVVDLDPRGVMVPMTESATEVCLAFAGNQDEGEVGIFGNLQQQTLEVVYDVAGGKLGFTSGGCS